MIYSITKGSEKVRNSFYKYFFLLFLFLLLTCCSFSNASNKNPIKTSQTEPMIVLFSDENSIDKEADYYDALLEIQKLYPDDSLPFQFVYSNNKEAIKYFNITTFPTLIVINPDETILLRLENSYLKEEIVHEILNVSTKRKESLP